MGYDYCLSEYEDLARGYYSCWMPAHTCFTEWAPYNLDVYCMSCVAWWLILLLLWLVSSQWTRASRNVVQLPSRPSVLDASWKVFGGSRSRTLRCAEFIKCTLHGVYVNRTHAHGVVPVLRIYCMCPYVIWTDSHGNWIDTTSHFSSTKFPISLHAKLIDD